MSIDNASIPRIIVAVAPEHNPPAVLRTAAQLAADIGAELELVTVVPEQGAVNPHTGLSEDGTPAADVTRKAMQQLAEELQAARAVHVELLQGTPAVALVAHVTARQPAFLVMGTRARRGIARALLGSVAEEVVRHAPCPVVVVPPGVA